MEAAEEEMNVVDEVTAIVSRVRALALAPEEETAQIDDAIAALPGVESSEYGERHRYRELMIHVRWGGLPDKEIDALARVRSLDIAAAPEVALLLPTAEGYVLVLRYWACPGETLVNVDASAVQFSKPASERFRADLVRLLDRGEQHGYLRGFMYWWVAQPSGTILLDSWATLHPCDEKDRAAYLRTIDWMLAERAQP